MKENNGSFTMEGQIRTSVWFGPLLGDRGELGQHQGSKRICPPTTKAVHFLAHTWCTLSCKAISTQLEQCKILKTWKNSRVED